MWYYCQPACLRILIADSSFCHRLSRVRQRERERYYPVQTRLLLIDNIGLISNIFLLFSSFNSSSMCEKWQTRLYGIAQAVSAWSQQVGTTHTPNVWIHAEWLLSSFIWCPVKGWGGFILDFICVAFDRSSLYLKCNNGHITLLRFIVSWLLPHISRAWAQPQH